MTVTLEPTAFADLVPEPEVSDEPAVAPKPMDEFVALLAQSYVLMPLFA